jgi:hypothetical protein
MNISWRLAAFSCPDTDEAKNRSAAAEVDRETQIIFIKNVLSKFEEINRINRIDRMASAYFSPPSAGA